jgi:outer membrane protein TolC
MKALDEVHEPSPEFRANLEWQIATSLRRENRFAAPVTGRARQLGAALVVIAALATGGIAGIAAGQVQDARQRDQLIETARSEESVARLRLDLAQANYDQSRRQFEVGVVGRETVRDAEQQLQAMRAEVARIQLDMEEIRATSAAPRNDLDAPLVGQRDFVKDRLTLELQAAQQLLAAAEQSVEQAAQRVRVGVVPRTAELQAQAEVAKARARLQQLMATLDLRQRYLKGDIKADALPAAARQTELKLQLARAQLELNLMRSTVEELHSHFAVGQASELDLKRAEVSLLERQLEMKRIQQELDALVGVKR